MDQILISVSEGSGHASLLTGCDFCVSLKGSVRVDLLLKGLEAKPKNLPREPAFVTGWGEFQSQFLKKIVFC